MVLLIWSTVKNNGDKNQAAFEDGSTMLVAEERTWTKVGPWSPPGVYAETHFLGRLRFGPLPCAECSFTSLACKTTETGPGWFFKCVEVILESPDDGWGCWRTSFGECAGSRRIGNSRNCTWMLPRNHLWGQWYPCSTPSTSFGAPHPYCQCSLLPPWHLIHVSGNCVGQA